MSRCKCDWSDEHTVDAFKRITPITHREEEQIEAMFRTYLIVDVFDRRTKSIYCTSCRERSDFIKPHSMPKLDHDPYNDFTDYYSLKHGDQTTCPFCGKSAEIVYAGKMGNRCEKMWQQVKVVVFHAEADGWLSAQAVHAIKNYKEKEWQTRVDFWTKAQYLFRPGCALQQVRGYRYDRYNQEWSLCWNKTKTIYEPFKPTLFDNWNGSVSRCYDEIGLDDCLSKTDMKYSAADQFTGGKESDYGLLRYLGEYCHRPQLEMLVKLELDDILRELIYCYRSNVRQLNWKAKSLPAFLRLDKWHTNIFLKGNRTIESLQILQTLKDEKYNQQTIDYLIGLRTEHVKDLRAAAGSCSMAKVVHYLQKSREGHAAHQLWVDYIRMAKDLRYDLTEETVFFPKNLKERHDIAAQTVKLKENEIMAKKFRRQVKQLKAKYEFSDSDFVIVIPETMHSIIEEGKALHHCVGSYVNRHISGETTILFLRKRETPTQPYGTIEIRGKRLIQLRGDYNNNIPREESRDFIDLWLQWIHAGSQRTKTGEPITDNMEVNAS